MFDTAASTWVKGRVLRYQPVNPHVLITIEETRADGRKRLWTVEGPDLNGLRKMDFAADFIKTGDVVEACGFPPRGDAALRTTAPGLPAAQFLHGHVLVPPGGRMRVWGPYGRLDHCVRPGDSTEDWVHFLKSEPRAMEFWCRSALSVAPVKAESAPLVGEINRELGNPCR
jgi:hypothetical protein